MSIPVENVNSGYYGRANTNSIPLVEIDLKAVMANLVQLGFDVDSHQFGYGTMVQNGMRSLACNGLAGYHQPYAPHPEQTSNPGFTYNPRTGEYVGMRMDTTEIWQNGPADQDRSFHSNGKYLTIPVPYLTADLLPSIPALTVAPLDPTFYGLHQHRLTLVIFRAPDHIYQDTSNVMVESFGKRQQHQMPFREGDPMPAIRPWCAGALNPGVREALMGAGYGGVRFPGSYDLTLLDPMRQVTSTIWYDPTPAGNDY